MFIALAIFGWAGQASCGEPPSASAAAESPAKTSRRTPLVELIERVAPSVVDIATIRLLPDEGATVIHGTGSILHESGYIITNNHVVDSRLRNAVTLSDGRMYPYRVVAKLPYEDLALIKIDPEGPLRPVLLGHSSDLMLGEDVLAVGNSHGLRHTVAPGIVSGLNRPTGPSAAALQEGMIQTNAAINPGNSGGPLFNALGEMIGVVAQKKMDAENISFAIEVDRLRQVFPAMMSPEQRFGVVLGVEVDTMAEPAKVTKVTPDSPAQAAGVRPGDMVLRAGKLAVRSGLDFYMALIGHQAGQPFPLELKRDGKQIAATPTLGTFTPPEPVKPEGLKGGLQFAAYSGDWDELPDFDKLKPVAVGTCDKFSEAVYQNKKDGDEDKEYFALKFTGFVRVPADGLYFFYTNSDDGSRLYIGDQLVVDNDGLHGVMEMGGLIRLKAGLYPITVTFFEKTGEEKLDVAIEGPNLPKQQIPTKELFFKPQEPAAEDAKSN